MTIYRAVVLGTREDAPGSISRWVTTHRSRALDQKNHRLSHEPKLVPLCLPLLEELAEKADRLLMVEERAYELQVAKFHEHNRYNHLRRFSIRRSSPAYYSKGWRTNSSHSSYDWWPPEQIRASLDTHPHQGGQTQSEKREPNQLLPRTPRRSSPELRTTLLIPATTGIVWKRRVQAVDLVTVCGNHCSRTHLSLLR